MKELIERIEGAKGASYALEMAIHHAVNPGSKAGHVPAYTASLDAAMTLASSHWAISANGDRPGWQAMDFAGGNVWYPGATPALAICHAALKARGE